MKTTTQKDKLRPFSKRDRERLQRENRLKELSKPKDPDPVLAMITVADLPAKGRGELVWKGRGLSYSLLYEVVEKPTPDGKVRMGLDLYGHPITHLEFPIRFWTPKKALLCHHCNSWKERFFFFISRYVDKPWCSDCYYKGTPSEHELLKHSSGAFGPTLWAGEWYPQEPLKISTPSRHSTGLARRETLITTSAETHAGR